MKDHRKERAEARKKAEKLVSQMTLLEKASPPDSCWKISGI